MLATLTNTTALWRITSSGRSPVNGDQGLATLDNNKRAWLASTELEIWAAGSKHTKERSKWTTGREKKVTLVLIYNQLFKILSLSFHFPLLLLVLALLVSWSVSRVHCQNIGILLLIIYIQVVTWGIVTAPPFSVWISLPDSPNTMCLMSSCIEILTP